MAICVTIHAAGLAWAISRLQRVAERARDFWSWTWVFILTAGWMVLLHLAEISAWAEFYTWRDAMPDFASAFYFSMVTYTTTGYGDLVLPPAWRLVGGIEALTGILMSGWSTGFFFAIVSRLHQPRSEP